MEKIFKNKKRYKAFSLVEMILVVAVSSIIALAVSQIFLTGMKGFEKNKEMQKNLEEARSSMEMMAKNIRMSKLTKGGGGAASDTIFMYNNSQKMCISYRFDNSDKKLKGAQYEPADPDNINCSGGYTYTEMTSGNISGSFFVVETDKTGSPQKIGRATIRMTMGEGTDAEKTIQTSISFRDYEDIIQ